MQGAVPHAIKGNMTHPLQYEPTPKLQAVQRPNLYDVSLPAASAAIFHA